jgi:hypothetical protein
MSAEDEGDGNMGFLDKLLGRKPHDSASGAATPKGAGQTGQSGKPATRESMLREQAAAMAIGDFDEAVKALAELYGTWMTGKVDWDLVGGYNYVAGKKDACVSLNEYLAGRYGAEDIHRKIAYHEGFPGDAFHKGSLDVIKWGYGRVVTDSKPRTGAE